MAHDGKRPTNTPHLEVTVGLKTLRVGVHPSGIPDKLVFGVKVLVADRVRTVLGEGRLVRVYEEKIQIVDGKVQKDATLLRETLELPPNNLPSEKVARIQKWASHELNNSRLKKKK